MVVWSALRPLLLNSSVRLTRNAMALRPMSGHHVFPYEPSRFQWNKFKDLMNFYLLVGAIPLGLLITYANVFVGPATLAEIPEDYEPKYWEYYRHPITRFIAKYMLNDPQQDYEKYLHHIYEEEEKARMRVVEKAVKKKISERHDYQAYYYRPIMGKYHRVTKETADYLETIRGD